MAGKKFGELNNATQGNNTDLYAVRQDKGGGAYETRKLTGALLFNWLKGKFGTAATKDVGTGSSQVPQNSDLGTAAYESKAYFRNASNLNAGTVPNSRLNNATEAQRGIVEKATTTEAKNGTANKFPDAAGVLASIRANATVQVSSLYELANSPALQIDGQVQVASVITDVGGLGSGVWRWDNSKPKADADFGTVFDPSALNGWDGSQASAQTTVLSTTAGQGSGTGTGAWVRDVKDTAVAHFDWFAPMPGSQTIDSGVSWQRANSTKALHIGASVYNASLPLNVSVGPRRIIGAGASWNPGSPSDYYGTLLYRQSTESTDPIVHFKAAPDSTQVEFNSIQDVFLMKLSAGSALVFEDSIRNNVDRISVYTIADGAVGLHFKIPSFFTYINNSYITERGTTNTGRGILIENDVSGGAGSEHNITNCHVQSTNGNAVEIQTPGFHIQGGQYDATNGIAILINNTDDRILYNAGEINSALCENSNTAVQLTGTTHPVHGVVVSNLRVAGATLAIDFDRADNCILDGIAGIAGTPSLAKWGANSVNCGVIVSTDQSFRGVQVDPGAYHPWMRVRGFMPYAQRANCSTDPNLTVRVDDCEFVGECKHNGANWNKFYEQIPDDGVLVITPPYSVGRISVSRKISVNYNGMASYIGNGASTLYGTSSFRVASGALTGTTGADDSVTVSRSSSTGKVYIENRSGATDYFYITFTET